MGKWQKRQCPLVILHFFLASHCKQNLKTFTMQAKVYHVCFGWCASQFHKSPCEGANVCEERRNKTLWQVKNKSWWTIRSSGIIMYFYCGQPATPRCNDVPCVAGLCTPSSEWWTPGGHKDLPSHSALCQRSARTRLWACQSWRQFCRPSSSGYRRQGNGNYDYGSRKKNHILLPPLYRQIIVSLYPTAIHSTPLPAPLSQPTQGVWFSPNFLRLIDPPVPFCPASSKKMACRPLTSDPSQMLLSLFSTDWFLCAESCADGIDSFPSAVAGLGGSCGRPILTEARG